MKKLLVFTGLLVWMFFSLFKNGNAKPYFMTASLAPGQMQGELITGALMTNHGQINSATLLPVFYHPVKPSDPWYKVEWSPLAIGGGAANGNAYVNLGPLLDLGPQIQMGLVKAVYFVSPAKGASLAGIFNPTASSYVSISFGAMLNLEPLQGGQFVSASQWAKNPLGYFVGPAFHF